MPEKKRFKVILIKWFLDEPKTGGDKVFMEIYDALKGDSSIDIRMIKPPHIISSKNRYRVKLPYILLFKFISNLISQSYIKRGYLVYNGTNAGNFQYVQPPPKKVKESNSRVDAFIELAEYIINKFTIFNKNSIKIAIYNSNYTMQNNLIKSARVNKVIYPGLISEMPDVEISEKENIIITISRIHREKGLERLEQLLPEGDFHHYILGYKNDAVYANFLEGKLTRTTFLYDATEEEKKKLLRKAKILIHPSISESAGIVLMEAMAYGVVPIAHNSGGVPEIIPETYLYDNENEAKELITRFLSGYNEDTFFQLKSHASRFLKANFKDNIRKAVIENFSMIQESSKK
ncbi:glycosyltransferase family 4 protein [Cuniculiplasma sp. SKW3]|uniref:glycosyltransferase family 4 protein n=1 Tax=Cuniculiplasma sp. SKW3 TaxID=3400170 RepID=UPI003FCFC8B0